MLGEWKDGVPRGAYHRVVQVRWQAAHIFVEPAASFRSGPQSWRPMSCSGSGGLVVTEAQVLHPDQQGAGVPGLGR